jgi:hypothetical protein
MWQLKQLSWFPTYAGMLSGVAAMIANPRRAAAPSGPAGYTAAFVSAAGAGTLASLLVEAGGADLSRESSLQPPIMVSISATIAIRFNQCLRESDRLDRCWLP